MTAKEWLNDIRHLDFEIRTMNEQIVRLRQEAEGIKAMAFSDMPRGGHTQDSADLIAEMADLQHDCAQRARKLMRKKRVALSVIIQIDRSELRALLMRRYFFGESWEQIADEMFYSMRAIFKLHGAALSAFEAECSKVQYDL